MATVLLLQVKVAWEGLERGGGVGGSFMLGFQWWDGECVSGYHIFPIFVVFFCCC